MDAAFFGVGVGFPPPASGAFVFAGFYGSGAGGASDGGEAFVVEDVVGDFVV